MSELKLDDWYKEQGFNEKCLECQCFHCNVDYAKLVGAPAWASTSCKFGINLTCDTCRQRAKEGNPNTCFHSRQDDGLGACEYYAEEGETC